MIPLAVIGNSQLIAIQRGWDAASDVTARFAPTFFGAPGELLGSLRLENSRLVPDTIQLTNWIRRTGGHTTLDLARYRAFLLVGVGIRVQAAVQIYGEFRLAEHARREGDLISRSALHAAIEGTVAGSSGFAIARKIRAVSDAPVAVMAEPYPAASALDDPRSAYPVSKVALPMLYPLYIDTANRMFADMGIAIAWQPEATKRARYFTAPAYKNGANTHWTKRPKANDHRHMNDAYGALVLRHALGRDTPFGAAIADR